MTFRTSLFDDEVYRNPKLSGCTKYPSPLSIRLTGEQKADLEARAGDLSVSAYAKSLLFAEHAVAMRLSPRNVLLDHQILGQVLARLGQSGIAPDLAELASAVRCGALPLDEVTTQQIKQSCADIAWMRSALMHGLGSREGL